MALSNMHTCLRGCPVASSSKHPALLHIYSHSRILKAKNRRCCSSFTSAQSSVLCGDSGGPRSPPVSRCKLAGDGDDDGRHAHAQLSSLFPAHVAVLACMLGCVALIQPAHSQAADSNGEASTAPISGLDDAQFEEADLEGRGPMPKGGAIPVIKRLLREVFADLVTLKQKVEDLTPKSDDMGDDVIIPHEGGGVTPTPYRVSDHHRLRAKAQVSGCVEVGGALVWSEGETGQVSGAAAGGSGGDALAQVLGSSLGGAPRASLLVQSMWPDRTQSLTARFTAASPSPLCPPLSPPSPSPSPHPSAFPPTPTPSLQLDLLMLRKSAWGDRVKVMVAPVGGTLANMARKLNPSAAHGLTPIMRHGHSVPMVTEGGCGAAALTGNATVTASVGHFVGASSITGGAVMEDGGSGGGCGTTASGHSHGHSHGQPPISHHTVGQLSLHPTPRTILSLVVSHTTASQPPQLSQPLANGGPQPRRGLRFRGLAGTGLGGGLVNACSEGGVVRVGAAGSLPVGDALVLSAWHSRALQGGGSDGGVGGGGGAGSGVRLATVPDGSGVIVGFTMAAIPVLACNNHSDPVCDTSDAVTGGRGLAKVSQNIAATTTMAVRPPTCSSSAQGNSVGGATAVLAELSASIPVQDGLCLTPGVVVVKEGRGTSVAVGVQSSWRF